MEWIVLRSLFIWFRCRKLTEGRPHYQTSVSNQRDEDLLAQEWFEIDVFFEGVRESIEQCFSLSAGMPLLLGVRRQPFGRSELVEPAPSPGAAFKHSM